ncbi:tyrosine-type recombinase/integrase [uncultured Microbacterium sp.]|nr:tyrosine-type recombinase/integrase [uncultured Microbacterium sp.]
MPSPARRSPESWGAIRKLPSGRFQASYLGPDGQRWTARTDAGGALTFDSKTRAREWLTKTRAEIQRGTWVSPTDRAVDAERARQQAPIPNFGKFAAAWVEQRRSGSGQPLRPKTATEYRRQLAGGLAELADSALADITPARVRDWHARRAAVAPTAAGAEARLLRAILNTAVTDGIITSNAVAGALTRTTTGTPHRPPTHDELAAILNAIEPRFKVAILLAAYGALRISEWRALRRSDLAQDKDRYLVTVARQAQHIAGAWVVGPPKSAEGRRVVALPAGLSRLVEAHLSTHVSAAPDALLFPPARGVGFLHDRQFADAWNVARDAAGVRRPILDADGEPTGKFQSDVREHDLRAFAATLHAQSGATLRETMSFLGHSTTAAALAYQHAADDRLREIADRMTLPVLT